MGVGGDILDKVSPQYETHLGNCSSGQFVQKVGKSALELGKKSIVLILK